MQGGARGNSQGNIRRLVIQRGKSAFVTSRKSGRMDKIVPAKTHSDKYSLGRPEFLLAHSVMNSVDYFLGEIRSFGPS